MEGNKARLRQRRALVAATALAVVLVGYVVYSAISPAPAREPGDPWPGTAGVDRTQDDPAAPAVTVESDFPGADEDAGDEAATGDAEPAAADPIADGDLPAELAQRPALAWPVDGAIAHEYGWGYNRTMEDYRFHTGIDLATDADAVVTAAAAGEVVEITLSPQWGWQVTIAHDERLQTRYANLRQVDVNLGQAVERGQALGRAGVGDGIEQYEHAHLHFEALWDDAAVNPALLLESRD